MIGLFEYISRVLFEDEYCIMVFGLFEMVYMVVIRSCINISFKVVKICDNGFINGGCVVECCVCVKMW